MVTKLEYDAFDVSDGEYSPDNFYVKSSDAKDKFPEKSWFKHSERLGNEMGALIASKQIGHYRTTSDLIRDAVYHRLHYLAERLKDDELMDFVTLEGRRIRMAQIREDITNSQQAIKEAQEGFDMASKVGDVFNVQRLAHETQMAVELARDPYRAQLQKILSDMMAWIEDQT